MIVEGEALEVLRGLPAEYAAIARTRIDGDAPLLARAEVGT